MIGPPVTVPTRGPPAVPPNVTSPVVNPVAASLKVTVKLIGLALVGSGWAAAWLIVTVGLMTSQVTMLSVVVAAALAFPARSVATPAAMVATTVPDVVIPLTATL